MSLPLLNKILETLLAWKWLSSGATVVDPFGGIGSTALGWCCLDPQNRAITIELEPPFVRMQEETKRFAEARLRRPLHWTIIQGDSREADRLMGEAEVGLTSAPYFANSKSDRTHERRDERRLGEGFTGRGRGCFRGSETYGASPGQIGNLRDSGEESAVSILSPPYGQGTIGKQRPSDADKLKRLTETPGSSLYGRNPEGNWFQAVATGYGETPGNIDLLPDGEENHSVPIVAVTSAPYAAAPNRVGSGSIQDGEVASALSRTYDSANHGSSPGQIANFPDTAITSAPYESQSGGTGEASRRSVGDRCGYHAGANGTSTGQIGTTEGETYASAVTAVYAAMARAGVRYLVSVTKNPTRNGKIRRLDRTTVRALRTAGYRIRAYRRAWLYEEQHRLFSRMGQAELIEGLPPSKRPIGRVSFFKRLHLAKGRPAAPYEDIYFCELYNGIGGACVD